MHYQHNAKTAACKSIKNHVPTSDLRELTIICRGKPLLTFLASYGTSDGKKRWQFVASDLKFYDYVLPDLPVTSQDTVTLLSDASISPSDNSNNRAPDQCRSLPDFEPVSNPVQ